MQKRYCAPLVIKMSAPLAEADGNGFFEGYASIFDIEDSDGDRVMRGAFAESLESRLPALLWQHDQSEPIGRFMEAYEDERGLYVRGQLSLQGRGLEAYALLKMGALDGLSIGFVALDAGRDAEGARLIFKADLLEISLVTFPANNLARIEQVKQRAHAEEDHFSSPRAFEQFLRRAGFSRQRAKEIIAKGFRGGERIEQAHAGKSHDIAPGLASEDAPFSMGDQEHLKNLAAHIKAQARRLSSAPS